VLSAREARFYPWPAADELEALEFYVARIKPEERLAFAAAVIEYAADRAGKGKRFIKKWSTLVAGEWLERDATGVLWSAIRTAAGIEENEGNVVIRGHTAGGGRRPDRKRSMRIARADGYVGRDRWS
jgi:hypothetical protein